MSDRSASSSESPSPSLDERIEYLKQMEVGAWAELFQQKMELDQQKQELVEAQRSFEKHRSESRGSVPTHSPVHRHPPHPPPAAASSSSHYPPQPLSAHNHPYNKRPRTESENAVASTSSSSSSSYDGYRGRPKSNVQGYAPSSIHPSRAHHHHHNHHASRQPPKQPPYHPPHPSRPAAAPYSSSSSSSSSMPPYRSTIDRAHPIGGAPPAFIPYDAVVNYDRIVRS